MHILILAILGIVTADVPTCSADISLSDNLGQNWAIHTDFTAGERQLSFTANDIATAVFYVIQVLMTEKNHPLLFYLRWVLNKLTETKINTYLIVLKFQNASFFFLFFWKKYYLCNKLVTYLTVVKLHRLQEVVLSSFALTKLNYIHLWHIVFLVPEINRIYIFFESMSPAFTDLYQ